MRDSARVESAAGTTACAVVVGGVGARLFATERKAGDVGFVFEDCFLGGLLGCRLIGPVELGWWERRTVLETSSSSAGGAAW